jgi:hypothetical protein
LVVHLHDRQLIEPVHDLSSHLARQIPVFDLADIDRGFLEKLLAAAA